MRADRLALLAALVYGTAAGVVLYDLCIRSL